MKGKIIKLKNINIVIHKYWKTFTYRLNKKEQNKLSEKVIFQYDSTTTLYDLFKYLNTVYEDIILNFEDINLNKINYKRIIRRRYRIFYKNKYIYTYDLSSTIESLIRLYKLDKIEIFFSFFTEIGGRLLELKGMQFYMYSKEQGKHKLPHIHVKYQNQEVVISLEGKILAGKIKEKMQKMAIDAILSDKESFLLKWNNMTDGEKFCFKKTELIRIDGY